MYFPNRSFTDIIFNRSISIRLICCWKIDIKIFVSAGDLLRVLPRTRGELSQIQEKDLLQSVETKKFSITGIHYAPRIFRSHIQKYVDKKKRARGLFTSLPWKVNLKDILHLHFQDRKSNSKVLLHGVVIELKTKKSYVLIYQNITPRS